MQLVSPNSFTGLVCLPQKYVYAWGYCVNKKSLFQNGKNYDEKELTTTGFTLYL